MWPGWDTIKVGQDYRDAAIEVRPRSGPTDGKWWAGHTASLNTPARTLADSNGTHTIRGVEDGPFHVHAHWIFTQSGRYEMEMRTINNNGDKLTEWHTVTFLVGDSTTQPGGNDSDEEGEKDKPASSSQDKQPGATKPDKDSNSTGTNKPSSDKSKASNSSGSNAGAKASEGNSTGKSEGSSKSTTAKGAAGGSSGPGSGAGGGSSSSNNGALAITGANVGWVLVLAAVFIAGGIVLVKKRPKDSQ